jgi:6-phosphogluconolactonase (cycloisomerase 2 family)
MRIRDRLALVLVLSVAGATPAWSGARPLEFLSQASRPHVQSPAAVALSPDGAHAYVASQDSAIATFLRDGMTGALTYIGDQVANALGYNLAITVSPDGAHVYVVTFYTQSVVVLARDAGTGALTFVEAKVPSHLALDVTVSPDGAHVLVSLRNGTVEVYARDAGSGALTLLQTESASAYLWELEDVDVSPDGAHVYVSAFDAHAVGVFSRDAGTGLLTFVEAETDDTAGADGLRGASEVAVSPDGGHVYVASRIESAVAVFARNAVTGALTFVEVRRDGVAGVDGLNGASSVTVSLDGAHVYVAAAADNSVAVFGRNAGTGALSFQSIVRDGQGGVDGLRGAWFVDSGPGGDQLYVTSDESAVVAFDRDAGTGALTFLSIEKQVSAAGGIAISTDGAHLYTSGPAEDGVAIYARDGGTGGLTRTGTLLDGLGGVDGLAGARSITLSPGGAHAYVAGAVDNAVSVFSRNGATGALTQVEVERDGVASVDGLQFARGLAVSPDGGHLYVAGEGDDAVAAFARNAGTGALTFVEVERDGVNGVDGLDGASGVALSPDGQHVYVASAADDAVAVFARDPGTGALAFVEVEQDGLDGIGGALGVVVSTDGGQVYVASPYDGVAVFARDGGTGALTLLEAHVSGVGGVLSGLGSSQGAIAVSPDGEQVYVGGLVFTRHPTGTLGFVENEFAHGVAIGVSPDGANVYLPYLAGVRVFAPGFGCGPSPVTGCRTAEAGRVALSTRGRLNWSWRRGQTTALADFGEPDLTTDYAFCLYDESGPPTLVFGALAPRGGHQCVLREVSDCWKTTTLGFDYRDKYRTPEGLFEIRLRPGADGSAQITLSGRGEHLELPSLPLGLPVRAQLQASNGECWEATYSTANMSSVRFSARPD